MYLYVPVAVKGLLIGAKSKAKYFGAFNDYSKLHKDVLGSSVENEFVLKEGALEPGVHLHWSLPDGLTKGVENNKKDDFIFPAVPDRWLVNRIWAEGEKLYSKNWVVESNAVHKADDRSNGSHTIPDYDGKKYNDKEKYYYFLGESYACGEQSKSDSYVKELKAVEAGDAFYSAYYPTSRNVFGFYDDMTGLNGEELENRQMCYCICGWYNNRASDPLREIATLKNCVERFGWSPPPNTSFSDIYTLCHGMLLNVEWKNKSFAYSTAIPESAPSLHIGNSTAEALSAGAGENERLLNHLIAGNQQLLESPKAVFEAENKLHSDRFSYNYSNFQAVLKPNDINDTSEDWNNHPDILKLNQHIDTLHDLETQKSDLMQEVYDNWVRYIRLGKRPRTPKIKELMSNILRHRQELPTSITNLNSAISDEGLLIEDLNKKIGRSVSNMELTYVNGQRYSTPNNIVMLLKNIKRDYSHGFDGRFSSDNTLKARTSAINTFTITDKKISIKANDLISHDLKLKNGAPVSDIEALINEAVILNTDFASVITAILAKKYKFTEDISDKLFKLQAALNFTLYDNAPSSLALSKAAGADSDYPDKVAVEYHKQPWNPLYLVWGCEFYPDKDAIKNPPMLNNWYKDGEDYRLKSTNNISNTSREFRGKAVITPQAASVMAGSLTRLTGDSGGAGDMMVLSQELDGINQLMIQRSAGVRFRPFDLNDGNNQFANQVYNTLKNFDYNQCAFDDFFSPLRAGMLKFTKVWIVDSFGQTMEINVDTIAISENLKYKQGDKRVMLPPRILQPARLNFDWILSDGEKPSPVYGFVIPNIMEDHLRIFDEQGRHLGCLQKVDDEYLPVKWFGAYETGSGSGAIPDEGAVNKDLYKFIFEIYEQSKAKVDVLSGLIKAMNLSLSSINPLDASQLDPMTLLFGRPLALMKGKVGLETMQAAITQKTLDAETPPVDAPDISLTDFNVYVGQSNNHNDGTIGFFVNSDYTTLHLSNPCSDLPSTYFSSEGYMALRLNKQPVEITFLADPIGEINLESLILPMTTVRMEQHLVSEALDNLFYTVFMSPILVSDGEIRIPVPDIEGKEWSYMNFSQAGEWIENEDIVSPTEADNFERIPAFADEGWLQLKKRTGDESKGV